VDTGQINCGQPEESKSPTAGGGSRTNAQTEAYKEPREHWNQERESKGDRRIGSLGKKTARCQGMFHLRFGQRTPGIRKSPLGGYNHTGWTSRIQETSKKGRGDQRRAAVGMSKNVGGRKVSRESCTPGPSKKNSRPGFFRHSLSKETGCRKEKCRRVKTGSS